jgi:hypothetical protein
MYHPQLCQPEASKASIALFDHEPEFIDMWRPEEGLLYRGPHLCQSRYSVALGKARDCWTVLLHTRKNR